MKLMRISASLLSFGALAVLAACGGGGGGGSAGPPPTSPPGGSPPPTQSPSTPPSASPSPTGSPGANTIQSNGTFAVVYDGTNPTSPLIYGTDNWQTNGVTDPEGPGDGDLSGGFTSSNTGPIDGVSCTLGVEPSQGQYHVHTFVAIYVNGTHYALPDAIGMLHPSGDGPGATGAFPNSNFKPACSMHTHAPSGIVHMEDPTLAQNFSSQPAQYNLQSLLDVWGQKSLSNLVAAVAPAFSGSINVYVGTPCANNTVGCGTPAKNPNGNGDDVVTTFKLQSGAPSTVLFGHHVAVLIIAGSMPAGGVAGVDFGVSN
jgi:hypothetical protein